MVSTQHHGMGLVGRVAKTIVSGLLLNLSLPPLTLRGGKTKGSQFYSISVGVDLPLALLCGGRQE